MLFYNARIKSTEVEESKYLVKLRELTETLPSLIKHEHGNRVDYEVENGEAFALGLLFNEDIAVANTFMSKDSIFPKHRHDEKE